MCTKAVYFFIILICSVHCKNVGHRKPRFIGGTYTSTVTSTQVVTSLVPSSCVFVDPTLLPCRSVRFLNFPHFDTIGNFFNNKTLSFRARSDKTETTPLGWGEYLGIYQPTVTVTQIELQTAIVQDPRVAVTYAVKGCRPLKLPSDLNRCEVDPPPTISILEILPTSTVAVPHSTAIPANLVYKGSSNTTVTSSKLNSTNEVVITNIESSTSEENSRDSGSFQQPTEPLPI